MDNAISQKSRFMSTCSHLGVPLELSKLEGPSTCLTFLGIEVDTIALQLRLPADKLLKLKLALSQCLYHKVITKHDLQSLTGLLQFATKVIHLGKSFLHQLHAMQSIGCHPNHHIHLNVAARADITWWYLFAEAWNSISMF